MYELQLNTMGEMNIAFYGEQRTPSRCGRLDQACAYGVSPVLMTFDGNEVFVDKLKLKEQLYWVFAELHGTKDTVKILSDLNKCYPFAETEIEKNVQRALGVYNEKLINEAKAAIEAGDSKEVGRLMVEAQAHFDKMVAPASPVELKAPVLHSILADEKIKEGECTDFITTMRHEIKNLIEHAESDDSNMKKYIDAMYQVDFKLDDLRKKYGKILESTDVCDIVSNIEPGKVNIINLSSVDEIGTDIIVHHTLKNVLNRRKLVLNGKEEKKSKRLDFPLFCIIEEAHMLVSQKLPTKSKSIIGQIAREGRKFGVGLCLISQSPKSLDVDALSQINNRIILRLVEPGDQKHVQKSSENLSEDLLKQLPSLNIGEAIVLGQMTKIPTMVKIDKFEGKTVGEDLDILSLWKKSKEEKEEKIKRDLAQMDEFL